MCASESIAAGTPVSPLSGKSAFSRFLQSLLLCAFLLTPHAFSFASESKFQSPKLFFIFAICGVFLSAALAIRAAGRLAWKSDPLLEGWAACIALWCAVSCAVSPFPQVGLLSTGAFLFFLLFFCVVAGMSVSKRFWGLLYAGTVASAAAAGFHGLTQAAGLDPILPKETRAVAGFVGVGNLYAGYLAMAAPLALGGLIHCRKMAMRIFYLACAGLIAGGLLAADVLAAYIAAIAGAAIVPALKARGGGKKAAFGAVGLALAAGLIVLAAPGARDRLFDLLKSYAAESRMEHWRAGLQMWGDRPLFGWGSGNFKTFFKPLYQQTKMGFDLLQAHNDYLQILIETGVGGLAIVGGAFFFIWRKAREVLNGPDESRAPGASLLGSLAAFAIFAFFSFPLHNPTTAMAALSAALLLFLAPNRTNGESEESTAAFGWLKARRPSPAGRIVAAILAVAVLAAPYGAWRAFSSEVHLAKGRALYESRGAQAAEGQLRAATEANPYNGYAQFLYGAALADRQAWPEATERLAAAARLRDFKNLHFALALCYRKMGQNEKAAEEYKKYLARL